MDPFIYLPIPALHPNVPVEFLKSPIAIAAYAPTYTPHLAHWFFPITAFPLFFGIDLQILWVEVTGHRFCRVSLSHNYIYSGFVFHLAVLPRETTGSGKYFVFSTVITCCSYNHHQVANVCALIHSGLTYLQVPTVGGQQCPLKKI